MDLPVARSLREDGMQVNKVASHTERWRASQPPRPSPRGLLDEVFAGPLS